MAYQYDILLQFVKRLAQPSKTASTLNLESWKDHAEHLDQNENFHIGATKQAALIAIECRKLITKMEDTEPYPKYKRKLVEQTIKVNQFSIPVPEGLDDPEASIDDVVKAQIIRVLHQQLFNKTRAAKVLGITVKTLYNKIAEYQIKLPNMTSGQPRKY